VRRWLHPLDFKDATKMERSNKYRECNDDVDVEDDGSQSQCHSFFTSLSLLPSYGVKMRCYGSMREYTTGIVFALPKPDPHGESEDSAAQRTHTWSWPSGYAAKTEYNITRDGDLINGRKEALVTISQLRTMNQSYVHDEDYEVLGKLIKGGFHTLPYNEIFCRVGGMGRTANDAEKGTGKGKGNGKGTRRSFDNGLGLPVALFVRTAMFGDLTALLRFRARLGSVLGKDYVRGIPLLLIDPDLGTRVLTEKMQQKLLTTMANSLNPFQNPHLRHKIQFDHVSETHFQQKLEELLDLDDDNIRQVLTPEECARLAGGYGATDESVANLLMDAMVEDYEVEKSGKVVRVLDGSSTGTGTGTNQNKLQSIVNEGLSSAVRSGKLPILSYPILSAYYC